MADLAPNTVTVIDRQRRYRIDCARLEEALSAVLAALRIEGQAVNLVLLSDRAIASLNRRYRGVAGPTDVLSFPMKEGEGGDACGFLLGDVAVSLETVERQCSMPHNDGRPKTGTRSTELALMLIHAMLHLVGYTHDASPLPPHGGGQGGGAAAMIAAERSLFAKTALLFPDFRKRAAAPNGRRAAPSSGKGERR